MKCWIQFTKSMWSHTDSWKDIELDFILHDLGKQWKRKVMIMAYTFLKSIKRLSSSAIYFFSEILKYVPNLREAKKHLK